MSIDIPYIHCFVRAEFLYGGARAGEFVEAYAFAVTAWNNRPLFFTVHTIDGALFSGLPVLALVSGKQEHEDAAIDDGLLQPWGCLGERVAVTQHRYLKDYEVRCRLQAEERLGIYLMTFAFLPDGGFADDPEQAKTFNLVSLYSGQFALLPNDRCLFLDEHFTGRREWPKYRRTGEYHMTRS